MHESREESARIGRTHMMKSTPAWWTDKHTSNWDHVKDALERDWEQTKADFSDASGQKLNQNVADTVKQSMGSAPIPPLGVKTHPTDPTVAGEEAEKARENMEQASAKATKAVFKAREDIAREQVKLNENVGGIRQDLAARQANVTEKMAGAAMNASGAITDAQNRAASGIAKEHAKIAEAVAKRDEAIEKWHDAERGVRYGYSVRTQYSADHKWDAKLEGKLEGEWNALDTGTSWHVSRAGIHRGWDYAGKKM